jgi:hypothetical protein
LNSGAFRVPQSRPAHQVDSHDPFAEVIGNKKLTPFTQAGCQLFAFGVYMAVLRLSASAGFKATSSRKASFMIGGATSVVMPVIKITSA